MTSAPPGRLTAGAVRIALGVVYLTAAALYAWQASKRASPTIFSDEIEFTQVTRAIAEGGLPERRGEPYDLQTLYAYLVAPAWWIEDTKSAWEAVKLIGVLVMTSAVFPAYALARLVVSRAWALAAAALSVAAPPLAFAPYLMEEPLAYPVATAALWTIAVALAAPTRTRVIAAVAVAALAPLVRAQLAVLVVVLLAALATFGWRSASFRRWRSTWTVGDWVGVLVLAIGAAIAASAVAGHRSEEWYVTTGFFKQRLLEHGTWSLAAVAIGFGVLPLIALGAAILSPRTRETSHGRAFAVTAAAAVVVFVGYAAVKGAYLSTVYGTVVVERNLIYLVPLAFAATAAVLSRSRAAALPALVACTAVALYLVDQANFQLAHYPYFEAPGLAITSLANREWAWDDATVRRWLFVTTVLSLVVLLARTRIRGRGGGALAVATVAVIACWSLTTEVYAARGLNGFAERLHASTPKPVDWIDRATGGEPAIYLGQQIRDPNPIWLMEFWNRSVERVWSLDGSAPAPTLSPDLAAPDGTLSPDPGVEWVVTGNGVEVVGERVGETRGNATLFHIRPPLRLRYAQNGVFPDGWMSGHATFSQYAADEGSARGFVRVVLSRQGACGANVPVSTAVVRVGTVVVESNQPALGSVFRTERRSLEPCSRQTVVVPATAPYHVDVAVAPTFVPAEIDPSSGDVRELGAQVSFDFIPLP